MRKEREKQRDGRCRVVPCLVGEALGAVQHGSQQPQRVAVDDVPGAAAVEHLLVHLPRGVKTPAEEEAGAGRVELDDLPGPLHSKGAGKGVVSVQVSTDEGDPNSLGRPRLCKPPHTRVDTHAQSRTHRAVHRGTQTHAKRKRKPHRPTGTIFT